MPALIGAFALGPIAGVMIELIKNLLHFITKTSTGGVGELANFLIGAAMVIPSGIIYAKSKKKSTALIGMLIGTILMATVGSLTNYYILIPFLCQNDANRSNYCMECSRKHSHNRSKDPYTLCSSSF